MTTQQTPAYAAAIAAHNAALAKYDAVRDAYRAGRVGDDEFLVARAELKVADAAFDEAFALEAAQGAAE